MHIVLFLCNECKDHYTEDVYGDPFKFLDAWRLEMRHLNWHVARRMQGQPKYPGIECPRGHAHASEFQGFGNVRGILKALEEQSTI